MNADTAEKGVAGFEPARVTYGDTDSVFVLAKGLSVWSANTFGAEISRVANERVVPKPHDLEFEKIYTSLLLYGKKMYAGYKFEPGYVAKTSARDPHDQFMKGGKLEIKGLSNKRRDGIQCINKIMDGLLDRVLVKEDPRGAMDGIVTEKIRLEESLQKVYHSVEGAFCLADFQESGSVSKPLEEYETNASPAVMVARRMIQENPNEIIEPGARIFYVFVESERGDKRKGACAVTMEEARRRRLPLLKNHYIASFSNTLSKAVAPLHAAEERQRRRAKDIRSFFGGSTKGERVVEPKRKLDRDKLRGQMTAERVIAHARSKIARVERPARHERAYDRVAKFARGFHVAEAWFGDGECVVVGGRLVIDWPEIDFTGGDGTTRIAQMTTFGDRNAAVDRVREAFSSWNERC